MTTEAMEDTREEFSLTGWLTEGVEGVVQMKPLRRILPTEFTSHVKAANKEMLLAWRSVLDSAIDRLERKEPEPKKVTKIKVQ